MPTDLTTLVTYGTFLVLCIVYLTYVTIGLPTFTRLLDRRCESITVADIRTVLPPHSGTVHSMSYLISNPLQLTDGRRLHRLCIFDQIAFGVRHLHVELYATDTENNRPLTDIDGRIRTLTHEHRRIALYLLVNGTMTEYNVLDLIDQLHEVGKCFVVSGTRPTAINLWVGGIRLPGNLLNTNINNNNNNNINNNNNNNSNGTTVRSTAGVELADRLFDRLRDYIMRMKYRSECFQLQRASAETWLVGSTVGSCSVGKLADRIAHGTEWENKVIWYEHIEDKINLLRAGTIRARSITIRPDLKSVEL